MLTLVVRAYLPVKPSVIVGVLREANEETTALTCGTMWLPCCRDGIWVMAKYIKEASRELRQLKTRHLSLNKLPLILMKVIPEKGLKCINADKGATTSPSQNFL